RMLVGETIQGVSDVGRQVGLRAVPVDRDIRNVRYLASLSVEYRLTRQMSIFCRSYWTQQQLKETDLDTRKTTRLRIIFGVNYFFEPIGLPI
ncbi:MAG: hypothetical protein ACR2PQ_06515, partial [Myxococcota bacterium]